MTEPGQLVRAVPLERRTSAVADRPRRPDPQCRRVRVGRLGGRRARRSSRWPIRAHPDEQRRTKVGGELSDVEPEGSGAWVLDVTSGEGGGAARVSRRLSA